MEYTESLWKGEFRRLDFEFEGKKALIVFPKERKAGSPWLWKTEYFEAFQDMELAMVRGGWCLAYIQNSNRWGTDDNIERQYRFGSFLIGAFGLNPKCVPVGMSCGGLQAVKFAAAHPDRVSALYLDAPVINLLSCPFGFGIGSDIAPETKQEALDALGLTMADMLVYRDHPLDWLEALAKAHIPAVLIWGDSDLTVPFAENGIYLKKLCEREQIPIYTEAKPGCGHHPHGPTDIPSVIRFIEQNI